MTVRLLLFDLDGTLMDAGGAGRAALHEALLAVYGRTGPIDGFAFHGKTDPAIVRELLRADGGSDAWIDEGLERLWTRYLEGLDRELRSRRPAACPGVPGLLARLGTDPRFVTGLLTGNVEGGAWRKLRACRLDAGFSFGAFGSDSEDRNDLAPLAMVRAERATGRRFEAHDVIVIGDTPADIRCARAAGARALAVATGGYSLDQLATHDPDILFPDLGDPDRVFTALIDGATDGAAEDAGEDATDGAADDAGENATDDGDGVAGT